MTIHRWTILFGMLLVTIGVGGLLRHRRGASHGADSGGAGGGDVCVRRGGGAGGDANAGDARGGVDWRDRICGAISYNSQRCRKHSGGVVQGIHFRFVSDVCADVRELVPRSPPRAQSGKKHG